MAKKKNGIALASVLAFEKKLVPSDGFLYGTSWEKRQTEEEPIALIEKSVRGTISNRLDSTVIKDPMKLNAKIENANPQTVDSASLKLDQDTLKLRFTLKVLPGVQHPSVCNEEKHGQGILKMVEDYIEKSGFSELAHRYATNIANGRFFWRNRVGAEKVEVIVRVKPSGETMTFDGYDYSLKNFDKHSPDLDQLSAMIADALCGRISYLLLEIEACVLMGHGQEVYPSEELILEKGDGKKSKVLYQVNGMAAMHSQKIGNALRTIDTWYPEYGVSGLGPIAAEPYGAVTTLGKAFRSPKEKVDFYTLFDNWSTGTAPENETDKDYVMAVLVRGGVFGASGKE